MKAERDGEAYSRVLGDSEKQHYDLSHLGIEISYSLIHDQTAWKISTHILAESLNILFMCMYDTNKYNFFHIKIELWCQGKKNTNKQAN